MSEPTQTEILDHVSAHFGISRIRVLEIFKTPTHPAEMEDTFAALALQGLLAGNTSWSNLGYQPEGVHSIMDHNAKCSYLQAKAMLKERAK